MKKTKMKLFVLSIIAVISMFAIVACHATEVFDRNDPTTWYEPAKNGGVDDTLIDQIEMGMTFSEIVDVLGKPQRDVGSGIWQMEWELKSGNSLVVSFNSMPRESNEEALASENIEYNLVSYHIEIRVK